MLTVTQTRTVKVGQVLRYTPSGKLRKVVAVADDLSGLTVTLLTGTKPSFLTKDDLADWTHVRDETHPGRGESSNPDSPTNAEVQSSVRLTQNASGKAVFEVKVYHVNPAFASGKAMELYDELVETYSTVTEPNAQ